MRRDTQIGIILGVVIIGIIAVFLSTMTGVKETETVKESASDNVNEIPFEAGPDIFQKDTFVEKTLEGNIDDIAPTSQVDNSAVVDVLIIDQGGGTEGEVTAEQYTSQDSAEKPSDHVALVGSGVGVADTPPVRIAANSAVSSPPTREREKRTLTHKVRLNDNLFSLAKRYYGSPKQWMKIYKANANVIYDRNSLPIGKELIIPEVEMLNMKKVEQVANNTSSAHTTVVGATTSQTDTSSANGKHHVVKAGDTLYALSKSYYGNPNKWKLILDANRQKLGGSNRIVIGQRLIIPGDAASGKPRDTGHYTLRSDTRSAKTKISGINTYTIKKGDTLYSIAVSHYKDGNRWKQIFNANRDVIQNSNVIPAGKVIVIP